MKPQPDEQNDFRAYATALWRWKWILLAFVVVIPLIAYVLEARKTSEYQSSTLVRPQAVSVDLSQFGGQNLGPQNIDALARLIQTTATAKAAAKYLKPRPAHPSALLGEISASADPTTDFLTITATDPDPQRAADIANAFAKGISGNQADQAITQIDQTITRIQNQINKLPRGDGGRIQLEQQLQQLRTLRGSQSLDPNAAVIERASPSGSPANRNTRRAVELGLVIALLLGIGAVAIAENSDRRVRSPDDLEDMTGLALLSAIPSTAFDPAEDDDLRDEEAFQMLRGALMYFNVDQRLKSIVITSPGQEDGKTTVSVRLAQSAARAGRNVVLVDADLRRPQIAPRLGMPAPEGLGTVLAGESDVWSILTEIPVRAEGDSQITAQGSLRILPAGPPAPNPSELLSSERMERLLSELEGAADLVIVDSAAALAVSDALPLLRWTSGVVVVARLNRTTRAGIRRLQKIITAANGTILGVVATGAPSRGGYDGYGYGYGYKDSRERKRANKAAEKLRQTRAGSKPEAVPEQEQLERPQQQLGR
jgi:capsular exopolysaccharide synthesis family protein